MQEVTHQRSMILVRPAGPDDAGAVAKVDASATATLRQTYRPNEKAFANRKRISRELRRVVALLDGQVVGTIQYYLDGSSLAIIGLGVLDEFRRRGVARALIEALAESARQHGACDVVVRTVKETGNVPIFECLGFHVVSETPDTFSESEEYSELTDVELQMATGKHC